MLPLLEEQKFHFLADFSKWIAEEIANEWSKIEHRRENGKFAEFGELEVAMDYPLVREKYAAQMITHLLNTLVDEQLRKLVEVVTEPVFSPNKPQFHSERIANLSFKDIKKKIEGSYNIHLDNVADWHEYEIVRNIDNSFKHRSGYKRFNEVLEEGGNINEAKHSISVEKAREYIEVCLRIVRDLHRIATLSRTMG